MPTIPEEQINQEQTTQEPPQQNAFGRFIDSTVGAAARGLGRFVEWRMQGGIRSSTPTLREFKEKQSGGPQTTPQVTTTEQGQTAQGAGAPVSVSTPTTTPKKEIPQEVKDYIKTYVEAPYNEIKRRYTTAPTTDPADIKAYKEAEKTWKEWQDPKVQEIAGQIFSVGGRNPQAIEIYNKARSKGLDHDAALLHVQNWAQSYTPPTKEAVPELRSFTIPDRPGGSVIYDPKTNTIKVVGDPRFDPDKSYKVHRFPTAEGESFYTVETGDRGERLFKNIQVEGGGLRKLDPTTKLKVSPSGLWMYGSDKDGYSYVSDDMAKKILESQSKIQELKATQEQKQKEQATNKYLEAQKMMVEQASKILTTAETRAAEGKISQEELVPLYVSYMTEVNKYLKLAGHQPRFHMYDSNEWSLVGPVMAGGNMARDPISGAPVVKIKNKRTGEIRQWKFSGG